MQNHRRNMGRDDAVLRDQTSFLTDDFLSSAIGRLILSIRQEERFYEHPLRMVLKEENNSCTINGQLDLLFLHNEQPVIVDYKYAKQSPKNIDAYFFQLKIYSLMVAELLDYQEDIRIVLLFLREQGELFHIEHIVSLTERNDLMRRLSAKIDDVFACDAAASSWPGVAADKCRELGCGFIPRCYRM